MALRPLAAGDEPALLRFVLMAAFPPEQEPLTDAERLPHVRRWLDGWNPDEPGVGWEAGGELAGAAWARRVSPVLARGPSGAALPEVIVAVCEPLRGRGVGRSLIQALLERSAAAGEEGLALAVGERNAAAGRLYEATGFDVAGRTADGRLTMVRRTRPS